VLTCTELVQFFDSSAKALESTGRLHLLRRKLLKRGHNTTLSKAAARLSKDVKERVHLALKWHRAAAQLCRDDGLHKAVEQNDVVAAWVQTPWLVESQAMRVDDAVKAALDSLFGGDEKELGAHLMNCFFT
jgi:hypothetical protein